jgi:putative transposase
MEYDLDTGAHSVYSLHYHLILTTKYRRGVLTEERTQFIRGVIEGFADKYGVALTNLDGEDESVPSVASQPTNRCGCVSIPVQPAASRRTETPTLHGTSVLAVYPN